MKIGRVEVAAWRNTNSEYEYDCRIAVIDSLNEALESEDIPLQNAKCVFDQFYGYGRPDIVVYAEQSHSKKEVVVIECKSSKKDLRSGYGLNFLGEKNYIIFPEGYLDRNTINGYLKEIGERKVGILMLDKNKKIKLIQRSPRKKASELMQMGGWV